MAARFSATQDLRRTANLPTFNAATICGWGLLVTDRNDFSCLAGLETGTSSANGLYIITDSDGTTLKVFDSGIGGFWTTSLGTLTAGGTPFFWALACSGAGSSRAAYFRLASSMAFTTSVSGAGSFSGTTAALFIGNDSSSEAWNGRIWNVKCWDRGLTAAELLVESFYRRVMFPSSLNFHWHLDRHDSTQDFGGNGRNATVTGTLTTEDSNQGLWKPRRRLIIPAAAGGSQATVTPSNASLSFAGQLATMQKIVTAIPANASLSFAGLQPGITTVISPSNASLSFAGAAPTMALELTIKPANASLSFAGQLMVAYTELRVSPGNASLSFAGQAPTIATDQGQTVAPGNASLSYQGAAPVIYTQVTATPANASLSFAGLAPGVTTVISPSNGSLSFAGQLPTMMLQLTIQPDNASLSFAGAQPTIQQQLASTAVTPGNASLSFQGLAPTINTGARRGHFRRRWRGPVYHSFTADVVILPAIGRGDGQAPARSIPRVGLGALAVPFVDPPRPKIEPMDGAYTERVAQARRDAQRRMKRAQADAREKSRRRRVQKGVNAWLNDERTQAAMIVAQIPQLLALRKMRGLQQTGRR